MPRIEQLRHSALEWPNPHPPRPGLDALSAPLPDDSPAAAAILFFPLAIALTVVAIVFAARSSSGNSCTPARTIGAAKLAKPKACKTYSMNQMYFGRLVSLGCCPLHCRLDPDCRELGPLAARGGVRRSGAPHLSARREQHDVTRLARAAAQARQVNEEMRPGQRRRRPDNSPRSEVVAPGVAQAVLVQSQCDAASSPSTGWRPPRSAPC